MQFESIKAYYRTEQFNSQHYKTMIKTEREMREKYLEGGKKELLKLIFRLEFYLDENSNVTALEKGPLDFS